jgi:hypothetical protein
VRRLMHLHAFNQFTSRQHALCLIVRHRWLGGWVGVMIAAIPLLSLCPALLSCSSCSTPRWVWASWGRAGACTAGSRLQGEGPAAPAVPASKHERCSACLFQCAGAHVAPAGAALSLCTWPLPGPFSAFPSCSFVVLVTGTVVYGKGDEKEVAEEIAEGLYNEDVEEPLVVPPPGEQHSGGTLVWSGRAALHGSCPLTLPALHAIWLTPLRFGPPLLQPPPAPWQCRRAPRARPPRAANPSP